MTTKTASRNTNPARRRRNLRYVDPALLLEMREDSRRARQNAEDARRVAAEHGAKNPELAGLDW